MIVTLTPWTVSEADLRFRKYAMVSVLSGLVVASVVSILPLPEVADLPKERTTRLAEIILPPPEPIKPPVVEIPKVEPPKVVEKKPEKPKPKEPEVIVAEAPQTVKQAKEKAKTSGLLAFQDQLQAMRDQVPQSELQDTATISRGSGHAAELERSIITSRGPASKKASVNTATLSRETGGIALAGRETTIVEAVAEEVDRTGAIRLVEPDLTGTRSIEEIRRVFDANKGAIFSIYNRALRKDPTLLGKVVLELVIEPDGTVSTCEVLTSELGSEELITRVVRRVQLFDFGAKEVGVTKISYPVHFLPT